MDKRRKILTVLVICVAAVPAVWLIVMLFTPGAPVYDPGYIFYDYENDTNYINENAPFINIGGRIYYIFKEAYMGGEVVNYCNNIAYIDYMTGVAYTVCPDKKCVHNALNFKNTCELVDFNANMVIDGEGYIYGSYEDGAFEDRMYGRNRDPSYNPVVLARYNLYNRSFQKLYSYKPDETAPKTYSNGFVFVYQYRNWVYFYEYIVEDGIGFTTYLRRYSLADNSVETLAEMQVPVSFDIFDGYIYIADMNGLYCYNLECDESSRVTMLDYSKPFFDGGYYAFGLQYDSYLKNIYFIISASPAINLSGGKLCYIKSYNYDVDSGVVDRKIHTVISENDVYTYQLTYDCVYYTLYGERYIGTYTAVDGDIKEYYDCTDGKLYSFTYTEQAHGITGSNVAYDFGDTLIRDFTVIGNYIYGDLYGKVEREAHFGYYASSYSATHQVRIDMVSGTAQILEPKFWKLAISK